ncbi:CPBP family intramembrane glutamic endopeptidase [uncultured Sunxiuqinia sp.]|uniref:CPBP family intramembrane glutamic endopeptidase n=1 Tax=uncultured Sunxiuqinia sp. TaxID=1573825 RepID=UPI002AA696A2|nr:CPBP family intramembrane glutamic endopeptidase [uncultured Sunxiuqinia sp.]
MAITAFRGMNPWSQFIFAAFIILVSFLLVFVLSILAVVPVIGVSGITDGLSGENLSDPSTIALLKYFQVVQSVGLFVLPPLVIAYLYDGNIVSYLNLRQKIDTQSIILGLLAVLAAGPLVGFLGELNQQMTFPESMAGFENWMRTMEDSATEMIDRFIQVETVWGLLFNLFMIAVIPAIGEELLFRGVIQKIFTQMTKNYHWGIWISAFVFSALHMQFYGFLPRMLLGGLFGYLLVYSGSLWLPILAHFFNNAIGVLALHSEQGSETVEAINQYSDSYGSSAGLAIVGIVLSVLLLYLLKKKPFAS